MSQVLSFAPEVGKNFFWGHNVHLSWHIVSLAVPRGIQPHPSRQNDFTCLRCEDSAEFMGSFRRKWENADRENEKHLFHMFGKSPFLSYSPFLECFPLTPWTFWSFRDGISEVLICAHMSPSPAAHKHNSVRYATRKFLAASFFFKQWVPNSQLLSAHLSASCTSWLEMLSF